MNLLPGPKGLIVATFVVLVTAACTPQARENGASQAEASPQMAENGASGTTTPARVAGPRDSGPAPEDSTKTIGEPAMAANGTSDTLYVARLRKALAIPLLAPTGTVQVKNGCLVATIDGIDHTAIFPPQARLIGPPNAPTAIRLSRRSVPLGEQVSLPAGGAEFSPSDLRSPIPGFCPRKSIVFAG